MSYLALYREWRPRTFDEVVEQKQAVYALRQSVIKNQIAHAYLFSGTRGTGKTTLAKIFSRAINCLNPQDGNPCNECQICKGILDGSLMDVVEMDAASNNSVDNIRRICDEVVFMPSLAKYKVYIVDEVHMLSTGAFNALLKTLEEPPAHAVFILATTEPHRLPATILSRCQRYDFRRIPVEGITSRLREISASDGIELSDDAFDAIAAFADGAMRDAISLLDQARASIPGKIERNDVLALAGITQDDFMLGMGQAVLGGKITDLLTGIDELVMAGRDLSRFIIDLAQFFRNLLICQVSKTPGRLIQATDQTLENMKLLSTQAGYKHLIKLIQELSELNSELRWSSDARTALEVGLIRIVSQNIELSQDKTYLPQPATSVPKPERVEMVPQPATTETAIIAETVTENTNVLSDNIDSVSETAAKETTVNEKKTGTEEIAVSSDDNDDYPAFSDDDAPPVSDEYNSMSAEDEDKSLPVTMDEKSTEKIELSADNTSKSENSTSEKEDITSKSEDNSSMAETPQPLSQSELNELWRKTLDSLQLEGEMVMYLFGKTATVQLCGDQFNVIFAKTDKAHYEEFSQARSQKTLLHALTTLYGHELKLKVKIEDDPKKAVAEGCATAEEPWIKKVRETADQFGIPVKMED